MSREQEIFEHALSLPSGQAREAYLSDACGQNRDLRCRVNELLASFDDVVAMDFMSTADRESAAVKLATAAPTEEGPGTIIGRYKLLQQIGEGGMGVVYMAEQEKPVRRRIALKIIKLGMNTKSVVARFESERQALAMMDHPNIAKVLDGGATDAGRPYFVMELVRGVKITEYCDDTRLSTPERIDLFIQVCQAIQHAHQKGIIHRDIKPSNILVTVNDGVAVPMVIDFGIAKATEGRLTDKTLFTQFEALIGTPAYMSPEQAVMSSLDFDTRSDIYSLGVLLYELLAGSTPFDGKELLASGIDGMRRTIREKEPVRPSARLVTLPGDELTTTAKRRSTETSKLLHQLQGDLDWIVMRCLEKDRGRRYQTANGLADDLRRFLNCEPVVARPPSPGYRLRMLVRRNRLAFAAVSIVTAVLVLGVLVSTWQAVRATQATHEAVKQRRLAEASITMARQAEEKAEEASVELNRNLYLTEMNLAGNAASDPGGVGRIAELTAKWIPENGVADLRGWEWYYLRSLLHRDLLTLSGHTGTVNSVAWSRDGRHMASGSADRTIRIWETATGQELQALQRHTGGVLSVTWSPDGRHLVSGSEDSSINVWDVLDGQVLRALRAHTAPVRSVAWSWDGLHLASGSEDGTVKIWEAGNWTVIRTLPGHMGAVNSVVWSPEGRRLASASYDRSIKTWDVDSGQLIHTFMGHEYWVNSVSWSPDGKRLASGGADRMVRFWDIIGRAEIPNVAGQFDNVPSVSWSPDGKYVASGCEDNTVNVRDANSGTTAFVHRGHHKYVFSVAWSPDGKRLASGSEDGTIKFWDATREETLTLRGHTNAVTSVAWSPDGRSLVSGSSDHTIKIWDPDSGLDSRTLLGHTDSVASVAWSPDGIFLVSGSQDRTLTLWNIVSRTQTSIDRAHNQYSSAVAWSPDGKQFASIGDDHAINVYDSASREVSLSLPGHAKVVHSVAWSLDGKFLASGSWDQTVRIWDARSGTNIHTLRGDTGAFGFSSVAWSQDGKYLAAGAFDKTVKVWEALHWQRIHLLRGHSGGVLALSWNPDGKRLASASFDGTVKLWDVGSGLETITLRAHTFGVLSVAWSPDGKRLASGGYDHVVRIWDSKKGYALTRE